MAKARPAQSELVRVLGIIFGLAAVVGGSVGQGILRQPGVVAASIPDPMIILLLWAVGGAVAAVNAMPFAEVGSSLPHAGGPFVYVRRGFGSTAGTIVGWSDWLNTLSAQAFMAVVVAEFIHRLGFAGTLPTGLLAPLIIAFVFALNSTTTKICGWSQSIGSAVKGVGLLALVLILFLMPAQNAPSPSVADYPQASAIIGFGAVIVAMRAVQNTYDGWNNCLYFCEEMHHPEKQVPRALFGGIALVTVLYLLVNAAMLHVLTPAQMAASNFAAADALGAVLGDNANYLLTLFGILSVGAILNLQIMFAPRIAFAMAREGVLPRALTRVAPGGSPRVALTVTVLGSAALAASGTYQELIAFNVALGALINLMVALAAWRLRQTEPDLVRPYRAPFYPLPMLAAALIDAALLAALIYDDPFHSLAGTGAAIVIGLGYRAFRRATPKVSASLTLAPPPT